MSNANCPYCGEAIEKENGRYVCESCDVEWVPHDREVMESIRETKKRWAEERREYQERMEAWESLSLWQKVKVKLGLREFDP
jgi:uncharacterized Zn finger protein (UPF0148 family)